MRRLAVICSLAVSLAACRPASAPTPPAPTTAADDDVEPIVVARTRIFDREGNPHTYASMLDTLAAADAIFVGETHDDDVTHRVETAVFEGIASRRDDAVVLSLEMFERDVQPVLDEYVGGTRTEAQMLADARPWPNYRTGYRPLVEAARSIAAPVVAANLPRPLIRDLSAGGEAGWRKAKTDHPTWVPADVYPPEDAYWARVTRVLRGHMGGASGDPKWSIQNLWDNTMGEAVATALDAHPESAVVHFAGGFHVAHFSGTVAQFRQRKPDATVKTVSILPTDDLATAGPRPELADFVIWADDYAKGPRGGNAKVAIHRDLEYRVDLPAGAPPDAKLPLLIWLPRAGQRPEDVALSWRLALGDQAAIAVVEPPIPEAQPDGRLARRWAYPTSFAQDAAPVELGLRRIVEYAARRLPIDPERIVIAGDGDGAATLLYGALYDDELSVVRIAAAPTLAHDLQHAAIPDDAPAATQIVVLDADPDRPAMAKLVEGFTKAGRAPTLRRVEADLLAGDVRKTVADALGVPPTPAPGGRPETLALTSPTDLGRAWAQLWGQIQAGHGWSSTIVHGKPKPPAGATVLDEAWVRARLSERPQLPRPPAQFGGATVLVLPARTRKATRDAWAELVTTASASRSKLSPVRLVTDDELAAVVIELAATSSDILVVPADFAVDDARMRALHELVPEVPEGVSIYWLPGLGGTVVHAHGTPGAATG